MTTPIWKSAWGHVHPCGKPSELTRPDWLVKLYGGQNLFVLCRDPIQSLIHVNIQINAGHVDACLYIKTHPYLSCTVDSAKLYAPWHTLWLPAAKRQDAIEHQNWRVKQHTSSQSSQRKQIFLDIDTNWLAEGDIDLQDYWVHAMEAATAALGHSRAYVSPAMTTHPRISAVGVYTVMEESSITSWQDQRMSESHWAAQLGSKWWRKPDWCKIHIHMLRRCRLISVPATGWLNYAAPVGLLWCKTLQLKRSSDLTAYSVAVKFLRLLLLSPCQCNVAGVITK